MKRPGTVAVLRFPTGETGLSRRLPVLLLAPIPGSDGSWLVCALSTRLHQAVEGFDEVIRSGDPDFEASGLKVESVVRIARLAAVSGERLEGSIGAIDAARLGRIRRALQQWVGKPGSGSR